MFDYSRIFYANDGNLRVGYVTTHRNNNQFYEPVYVIGNHLQSIGEALKNLDKRERELLLKVADQQYWSEIIKARDFISHHYVDIDSETVFDICSNELGVLEQKILSLASILAKD